MRDRERERIETVAGKGATADGGWHIDGIVMVGQYTQTRQRRLRAKTVKSSHDRRYKKRILP